MHEKSTMPRINELDPEVYNKIAAGEVVERPASVVKELLENALDADATKITIQVEQSGIKLIHMTDNGHGIHPDDMALTLKSHSTSKLLNSDDLNAIQSLGFRGEALASIASVSKLSIQSCPDNSQQGKKLVYASDRELTIEPCSHAQGTSIEVRDLFFNTPARKKFLRSANTEYQTIVSIIKAISLCHFNTRFKLLHNNRVALTLSASKNNYERRLQDICGLEFINHMTAFDFTDNNMRFWGWLGAPSIARNQTDRQYLYLNRRFIKDKHIQHAIKLAFNPHLHPGRYASYVVFLEMPATAFDVNVHPSKQEVRFQKPRDIHDFIFHCLEQILNGTTNEVNKDINDNTEINSESMFRSDKNWIQEKNVEYINKQTRQTFITDDNTFSKKPAYNQRYSIHAVEEGFLLMDIMLTRSQKIKETLESQSVQNQRVISRPLLIPFEYQNTATNIDIIESVQADLDKLGFSIRRNLPEQLMIKELPECVHQMNIRDFLNALLAMMTDAEVKQTQQPLIELIVKHGHHATSETLSEGEVQQLFAFCYKRRTDPLNRSENFYRILDEQALYNLLKQSS